MTRDWMRGVATIAVVLWGTNRATGGVGPVAQWIWPTSLAYDGQSAALRYKFHLSETPLRADLSILADDRTTVYLNGRLVGRFDDFRAWSTCQMTHLVAEGSNSITVHATNRGGPAGVALKLRLEFADNRVRTIVSDPTWSAIDAADLPPDSLWTDAAIDDQHWDYAASCGLVGVQPWGEPAGEEGDYDQWAKALREDYASDAGRVEALPGFAVELLRSAQPGESSWISLTFDPQGRILIGKEGRDENHGLLRLTLGQSPKDSIVVESIENTLLEPRGLAFFGDELLVNANNAKALYRLRDPNDQGRFQSVEQLRATPGDVGHGRNNLTIGPEGMLFLVHGNDVRLPDDFDPAQMRPLHMSVDRLRACHWDRFLFDTQAQLPAGHIVRTTSSGRPWEVFAAGFRNPYGIDANAHGELFTFDADNEGDLGTPWYRSTRVNHVVAGGDYGWRQGTAMRPSWYPDSCPTNLDLGKSSPTDVKFGHRSHFPAPYREALFILDWSYGKIYALELIPRGASYAIAVRLFLEGRPLNVTDLEFGPDGAMYFVTGGRGTQSGLYRVRFVGPKAPADEPVTIADEALASATRARERRRALEDVRTSPKKEATDFAWPHLSDLDSWIRQAARLAIERQPIAVWKQRALEETRPLAAVTALMALARAATADEQVEVLDRLNQLPLVEYSRLERLTALRAYQLALIHGRQLDTSSCTAIREHIEQIFPADATPLNQLACELLIHLNSPHAVTQTIGLLECATTQEETILWLHELRNVPNGWSQETRATYVRHLATADTFIGGRELPVALYSIANEFRATLGPDEAATAESIDTMWSGLEETPAEGNLRPVVRQWRLDDLTDHLGGIDGERDLTRGRRVFSQARCADCHRLAGEGRSVGPDLRGVSRRFPVRDLMEAILAPSRVVDAKYRDTVFELDSGQVLTGRVIGGDQETLLISTNAATPLRAMSVRRESIAAQHASDVSPMPTGLLDSFSQDEIFDLLAYLVAASEGGATKPNRSPSE